MVKNVRIGTRVMTTKRVKIPNTNGLTVSSGTRGRVISIPAAPYPGEEVEILLFSNGAVWNFPKGLSGFKRA